MHSKAGRAPLERKEPPGNRVVIGQRSQNDPLEILDSAVGGLDAQRPLGQSCHQKGRTVQRLGKLPVPQDQVHFLGFLGRRQGEFSTRLHESLQLRFVERPSVDAHFVDLATELRPLRNPPEMQVQARIAELRRSDCSLGHLVSVHVEHRPAVRSTDHGGHVLPGPVAEDTLRRSDPAVRLLVRSGRLDPDRALVAECLEVPAVGPLVHSEGHEAGCPKLSRADPRRDGEVAGAHIRRLVPRNDQTVVLAVKGRGHSERRIDISGVALESAGAVAVERPRSGKPFGQAGRGSRKRQFLPICLVEVDLVDSAPADRHVRRPRQVARDDGVPGVGIPRTVRWVQQQAVVVPCGRHGHAEPPAVRELPQRDLEVRLWTVRPAAPEDFVRRDGRPQQQSLRDRLVRAALGVAAAAAHACEHRVVDAVEVSPAPHGGVSLVALDEAVPGPHGTRLEGERLDGDGLADHVVRSLQKQAVRAENELVGKRIRVDSSTQIHPEALDRGLRVRIDNRAAERVRGDLEVGLHLKRRELERAGIVDEPVLRHRVRRQCVGQFVLQQEEAAEGVAVLGHGEPPHVAVLRGRTGPCRIQRGGDPIECSLPLRRVRLRGSFGGHGPVPDPFVDQLPQLEAPLFESAAESVETDSRHGRVLVVTQKAVLLEERPHLLLERRLEWVGGTPCGTGRAGRPDPSGCCEEGAREDKPRAPQGSPVRRGRSQHARASSVSRTAVRPRIMVASASRRPVAYGLAPVARTHQRPEFDVPFPRRALLYY